MLILKISLSVLILFLGGCAVGTVAPGYVKCTGKGNFTATGSMGGGVIYGGLWRRFHLFTR